MKDETANPMHQASVIAAGFSHPDDNICVVCAPHRECAAAGHLPLVASAASRHAQRLSGKMRNQWKDEEPAKTSLPSNQCDLCRS